MNVIRKVYAKIKNVVKFLYHRCSRTGEKRDIVYVPWSGKRNEKRGVDSVRNKKPNKTTVLTKYVPPEEIHHSNEGFTYSIADRSCKRWTDEEWDEYLVLRDKGVPIKEIAEILGRSENSINSKVAYMKKKER